MATPSTEQRELDLVEKVDFRILNVANNEKKLQELLSKFLVPLLLKGASDHASVRSKVATVAQRLKLFIQPPGVVLPVAALLQQLKTTDSTVVRHLDIVFIQHSIQRLTGKERRDLIPSILKGISNVNSSTPALFVVLLQSLSVLKVPSRGSKEDEAFSKDIGLSDPADANYVAERFGRLFLLKLSDAARANPSADVAYFGFDQEDSWLRADAHLAETRLKVISFLASGAFNDDQRFMPALYAASHNDSRVSSAGEEVLKRSTVSLESKELVEKLYRAHSELATTYRIRILGLLSKSAAATAYGNEILAVVKRDMDSPAPDAADGPVVGAVSSGLEMAKLYKALFEFINWIARIGPNSKNFTIGRPLIDHLKDYIIQQGWPTPINVTGTEFVPLRAQAYETIGMLAKGADMTMPERVELVHWFFRSLTEDTTAAVVVNVDGALSSMTSMFSPGDNSSEREEIEPQLRSLLLKYINLSDDESDIKRSARHAAAKWANNCLPFSDPMARWIDILAAAGRRGERSDVVEEGHKGLDPWTYYSNNVDSLTLPEWQELVRIFFKVPIEDSTSAPTQEGELNMDVDSVSTSVNFPGEKIDAFPLAVNYCRRILFLTALPDFKVEPGWEQQLESLVRTDKQSRDTVRSYLKGAAENSLVDLLTASFDGMLYARPTIAESCGQCFVDLASLSPKSATQSLASRATELLPLVKSNKKEIRKVGAAAIGILGAHPSNDTVLVSKIKDSLVESSKPWKAAVGSELNATEGAFVALAHLLSRLVFYGSPGADKLVSDVESIFPSSEEISGASLSFQDAIFDSLSQLWTASVKCLPASPKEDTSDSKALVDVLSTQAKKGNERAITSLGRLAIVAGSDTSKESDEGKETEDVTELILTKLYDLYELKQVEVHFAVGGAITAAIGCWDADVVELSLDVEEGDKSSFRLPKRTAQLTKALDKILTDCKTTKPSLLKASGIWLFTIIQHCSHLQEIQSRLRECQVAFMRLLSARDELVQETASRGLALVYERGDEALKGDLVKDLVTSFTGSSTQLKVDDDTELFDAGALPTGEGKSVTSYKDIVSLANEVGDQTLIYKFMSLAANAATWSTRSAFGRFGLSNILSESEVDPKLYPKLFRYRFDPNPNVQRSMNDIWKALVKDSNAVIDEHYDAIMTDLLITVLGKEWRVREAGCAAISDLVQGRPFSQYEKFYEEIWAKALKVLDDVKGSVREAALKLCITLSNTLVRQLEEGSGGSNASAMMNEALPFLMSEKGIESGVEDVKIFATVTVLKIAKHGGKALRPYIAAMVPHLLGLLSTIEPQAFNYYYMRSGDEDKEKLDKMRSAMVSQSPISEAIENCLRNVDGSVMKDLAPGIEGAMKSAVGMPTKIGCGRVLSTLATRHTTDFAPYAGKFLQLLEKQSLDRNDEVSQSYAKTAAYVMRVAPDEARQHFATRFIDLYFSSEDENRRQKVADAVLALSKISPDHFNALESSLLPFAYLASHDTDDYVRKACDEVWSKHAGSNLSVSRYVPEIVGLITRSLDTAQWALKHAGALTSADAVKAVLGASDLSGQINTTHLKTLWPLYEKSLAQKTFAGKEKLLEVFPDFVAKGKPLWSEDSKMAASLRKIATVEAKRNNDAYRVHAFKCLWKVAAAREDINMWDDVVTIVTPHLEALKELDESTSKGGNRMDVDSKGGKDTAAASHEKLVRQTAENGLDAVARSYNRTEMKKSPAVILSAVWKALDPFLESDSFTIVRRGTWYKAATELLEAAAEGEAATDIDVTALINKYLSSLDVANPEAGTEAQRSDRAKAVKALAKAARKGVFGPTSSAEVVTALAKIKEALKGALATERSLDVQKLLKEAIAES